MYDSVTAESLYADLLMQGSQDSRVLLIVEGPEDRRALDAHIDETKCLIILSHGRKNALGCMKIATEKGMARVVALVDSDWGTHETEPLLELEDVVSTVLNDLDSEILHAPGLLDRIASSHVDVRSLRQKLRTEKLTLVEALDRLVDPISVFRQAASQDSQRIPFKDFPIQFLYGNEGSLLMDLEKTKIYLSAKTGGAWQSSRISTCLSDAVGFSVGRVHLHNGHHLFEALNTVLKKESGYKGSRDSLEKAARAAIGNADRPSIPVFTRLDSWCQARTVEIWNVPFAATG